jgi:hypothetical protein
MITYQKNTGKNGCSGVVMDYTEEKEERLNYPLRGWCNFLCAEITLFSTM